MVRQFCARAFAFRHRHAGEQSHHGEREHEELEFDHSGGLVALLDQDADQCGLRCQQRQRRAAQAVPHGDPGHRQEQQVEHLEAVDDLDAEDHPQRQGQTAGLEPDLRARKSPCTLWTPVAQGQQQRGEHHDAVHISDPHAQHVVGKILAPDLALHDMHADVDRGDGERAHHHAGKQPGQVAQAREIRVEAQRSDQRRGNGRIACGEDGGGTKRGQRRFQPAPYQHLGKPGRQQQRRPALDAIAEQQNQAQRGLWVPGRDGEGGNRVNVTGPVEQDIADDVYGQDQQQGRFGHLCQRFTPPSATQQPLFSGGLRHTLCFQAEQPRTGCSENSILRSAGLA